MNESIPKYQCIVVDPPWSYGDEAKADPTLSRGEVAIQSVTVDYEGTMTIEQIKDFKLPRQLADPENCLCFLWTVNRYLYECPTILERWGFNIGVGGRTMVWHKTMGVQVPNNWRSNTEFIVVGSMGNKVHKWRSHKGLQSCFLASNQGHSIKPVEFYRMIRSSTFGPRVDIFARRRHEGFDAWGNQVQVREKDLAWDIVPKQRVIKLGTGELHIDINDDDE